MSARLKGLRQGDYFGTQTFAGLSKQVGGVGECGLTFIHSFDDLTTWVGMGESTNQLKHP